MLTTRQHSECYIFKIGPDYTIAHYYTLTDAVCLSEWSGRPFADFDRGMRAAGWLAPDVNRYTLPHRGEFTEYTYNRRSG
jgi:hypothetical protein